MGEYTITPPPFLPARVVHPRPSIKAWGLVRAVTAHTYVVGTHREKFVPADRRPFLTSRTKMDQCLLWYEKSAKEQVGNTNLPCNVWRA